MGETPPQIPQIPKIPKSQKILVKKIEIWGKSTKFGGKTPQKGRNSSGLGPSEGEGNASPVFWRIPKNPGKNPQIVRETLELGGKSQNLGGVLGWFREVLGVILSGFGAIFVS